MVMNKKMEINFRLVAVIIAFNVIIGVAIVMFGDITIFIEEGVMNFWAMIGALGAFVCSFILLVVKLAEKIEGHGERGY